MLDQVPGRSQVTDRMRNNTFSSSPQTHSMKKTAAIFSLLFIKAAFGATYTYNGANFNSVMNFTAPCNVPVCTAVSTAMRFTGTFDIAPLPPNLNAAPIPTQLQSFSFTDGNLTFTSADPKVRVRVARASTNAQGQLTGFIFDFQRWQSPGTSHVIVTDRYDNLSISSTSLNAHYNQFCFAIGPAIDTGVADSCNVQGTDTSSSRGNSNAGTLSGQQISSIPTLNEWALASLGLLIAAIAITKIRLGGQLS
ncbi:IPTL-CTERM sorting domain-containing protein [Xylophilus sp. Leaf220]|uniref:IPTL-CTERM sorting domain-containing protein n=1 Tax=Xylophilus sp. Leaf220 TaxID=1735686 RepID=UPI0012E32826|nr:IPTL-CTERM sorting domain-containing protein [Xylophilus sp. Leaf220]